MGITNPTLSVNNKTIFSHTKLIQLPSLSSLSLSPSPSLLSSSSSSIIENSMSQEYHQQQQQQQRPPSQQQQGHVSSIFNFPNGFDKSTEDQSSTSVDPTGGGLNPVYESAGMLSEMFNFGPSPGNNTGPQTELLDYQRTSIGGIGDTAHTHHEWYGDQHNDPHQHHNQIGGAINAHNSAAAMQLFMTSAPPRSPSPPPPPPSTNLQSVVDGFHSLGAVNTANNPSFWHLQHHPINNPGQLTGIIEGQGLSLSLSSSLQQFEAKQAEDNQIMFFNQHQQAANSGVGLSSSTNNVSSNTHFFKNLTNTPGPQAHNPVTLHSLQPVGGFAGPSTSSVGFGSASTSGSLGVVNVLRNSKYAKPAQELLEEFCSVGRGHQLKKPKLGRQNSSNNPNSNSGTGGGVAGSSSSKEPPQLSPSDRIEHQRRKVKLLAMLDEVDRRYNHYCEQMQMVVNSFDLVMGYGGAIPYTALAQKAMSRHFRCLKDAIHAQVKHSCELLGEKDPTASSGLTKGETPRLKMLEQSLRQQRAFHQMGMMDQEAWRPQRGLPERSVNILRAWLFEHFLHPYPSDADKHLLARQTGLSRNQVSNWFINARVRLWKPMVEEMYQQEAKDREDGDEDEDEGDQNDEMRSSNQTSNTSFTTTQSHSAAQNAITSSASATTMLSTEVQRSIDTIQPTQPDCDPSIHAMNRHQQQQQHVQSSQQHAGVAGLPPTVSQSFLQGMDDTCQFGSDVADDVGPTTMIRFGAASGDVSLTLGLRHSGNAPEKSASFSVRDFGSS